MASCGTVLVRRTDRLVVREFGDEAVVYDLGSDRVTHLDAVTAAVWAACDGTRALGQVAETAGVDPGDAAAAAARLHDAGLLDAPGISRRQLLQRLGIVAAIVPLVSVAAATAASAASVPTVTALQLTCSSNSANDKSITLQITVTGFAAGVVAVDVTYKPPQGPDTTQTVPVTVTSGGTGLATVTIRVKRSLITLAALQGSLTATGNYSAPLC
jgi:hypothetical protein